MIVVLYPNRGCCLLGTVSGRLMLFRYGTIADCALHSTVCAAETCATLCCAAGDWKDTECCLILHNCAVVGSAEIDLEGYSTGHFTSCSVPDTVLLKLHQKENGSPKGEWCVAVMLKMSWRIRSVFSLVAWLGMGLTKGLWAIPLRNSQCHNVLSLENNGKDWMQYHVIMSKQSKKNGVLICWDMLVCWDDLLALVS